MEGNFITITKLLFNFTHLEGGEPELVPDVGLQAGLVPLGGDPGEKCDGGRQDHQRRPEEGGVGHHLHHLGLLVIRSATALILTREVALVVVVICPGQHQEGRQTREDQEAATDEEGEEEAPAVEEQPAQEGPDGGAGPEHRLHDGQHGGLAAPVAPHGQWVDGAAHGGLADRREGPHQQGHPEEDLAGLDGGEEAEQDVGEAGADTAEYEQPGD